MYGREFFHESVVKDIVDVITSLKDYDEVQFLTNSASKRSFKSYDDDGRIQTDIKLNCKFRKADIDIIINENCLPHSSHDSRQRGSKRDDRISDLSQL